MDTNDIKIGLLLSGHGLLRTQKLCKMTAIEIQTGAICTCFPKKVSNRIRTGSKSVALEIGEISLIWTPEGKKFLLLIGRNCTKFCICEQKS